MFFILNIYISTITLRKYAIFRKLHLTLSKILTAYKVLTESYRKNNSLSL